MKGLLHSLFILTPILSLAQVKPSPDSLSFYFEFGQSEISVKNQRNFDTKNKLTLLRSQNLVLRAYTDSVGSPEYNKQLAGQRLEAAKKLILQAFPDQFAIRTEITWGEDQSSLPDREKRRVDILILPEKPAATAKKGRQFEIGVPIKLEIQFAFGQDVMLPSSYNDIRFLIETLQQDSTLTVILAGHVCCGTDGDNLSGRRADRVRQILIMEGNIAGSRIKAIGFGNSKPLFVEDSEAHRQANRRVEATFYRK